MAKRRLFIGTFLPDNQRGVLTVDAESAARLAVEWRRKIRWVRPDKFHITWLFLGSVEDELRADIEARLQELVSTAPATQLTYNSIQLWPNARRAKTMVVIPDTVPPEIAQLGDKIKRQLGTYAENVEPKFRPHITLARMDPHGERIAVPEWFPVQQHLPLTQHIDSVQLIESDLRGNKEYTAIAAWNLQTKPEADA